MLGKLVSCFCHRKELHDLLAHPVFIHDCVCIAVLWMCIWLKKYQFLTCIWKLLYWLICIIFTKTHKCSNCQWSAWFEHLCLDHNLKGFIKCYNILLPFTRLIRGAKNGKKNLGKLWKNTVIYCIWPEQSNGSYDFMIFYQIFRFFSFSLNQCIHPVFSRFREISSDAISGDVVLLTSGYLIILLYVIIILGKFTRLEIKVSSSLHN